MARDHDLRPRDRRARTSSRTVLATLTLAAAALTAAPSSAGLGGFEAADGYAPFLNMVQNYNAGQYGTACGFGGTQMPIAPNSGLWEALAGGFSSGGSISYATGHSWYDRTYRNSGGSSGSPNDQALVLTTGHEGWSGPALKYKYNLDACDLGCEPDTTGNKVIKVTFWVCWQLAGPEIGGQLPNGYFGDEIAFLDSSGNVGFTVGLTQRPTGDTVTYWNGSTMFESATVGSSNRYDRWEITLDLAADTVSADFTPFSTGVPVNVVNNVAMMTPMANFTAMTFRTSPGVNNAKLMSVDDFSFEGCDDCTAEVQEVVCELDGSGDVTATIKVTNNSSIDATRLLITPLPPGAPVGVSPNVIDQLIPGNGGMHTFDVTFAGLIDGEEFCFVVTLLDETGNVCCSTTVCITPDCDCLQIRSENAQIMCSPDGTPGKYIYTFQFDNLTPDMIHHVYFFPPTGVTISPNYVPMVPPVGPNQTSQPIMVMITGATPGEKLYFDIAIHDEFLNECCTQEVCVEIPVCDGDIPRGACCIEEPGIPQAICLVTTQDECENQHNGVYLGDNTTCNPNPCIPDPGESTTHLTAVTRCCWPQDMFATTTLTICNTTGAPKTYNWTLDSVITASCPVAIDPSFIMPNAGMVTVAPGDCVEIPIRIACEGTLNSPNGMFCLESNVTDTGTGTTYTNTGKVMTDTGAAGGMIPDWCIRLPNPDDPTFQFLPGEEYVNAQFDVTNNTDSPAIFMYFANGGGTLSIDGASDGSGVENFMLVGPGETVPLLFAVGLTEERPFEIFDVILFSDLNADGELEPVLSQAYTTARGEPCAGDTNNDDLVNFSDLNTILTCFGLTGQPGHLLGDLTRDGVVNFADLNEVLTNFGNGCD
ncbi:MAG: hypothetical protein ACTS27_02705 [Phycisphaerales bacterium]